ncbi:MAG: SH3 domain-containing protein [Anaerolineae bacterium]
MSLRNHLALLFAIVILPVVTGCQGIADIGRAEARESIALLREIAGIEAQAAPAAPAVPLSAGALPSDSRRSPSQRSQRAPAPQEAASPTPAPTETPGATGNSSGQATVLVDTLNVRAGPGLNYNIVEQVQQGDSLNLLQDLGTWLQVRTPSGTVGYVMATYTSANGGAAQVPPVTPRGSSGPQWQTPPGGNVPPGWGNNTPFSRRGNRFSPAPLTTAPAVTDNVGNSVRVADQTSGTYTFDAAELMRLLRDEGITNQDVVVMLMDGSYGNRSETTFGRMLIDCNPINVPVDPSRPNPPGNGKIGADFCNAVAMHETYHLITLVRENWGGEEADADAFATQRLNRYSLVTGP